MILQCVICRKKVEIKDLLFVRHEDKRGRLCYGSFAPMSEFNPFPQKSRYRDADEWINPVADIFEQANLAGPDGGGM